MLCLYGNYACARIIIDLHCVMPWARMHSIFDYDFVCVQRVRQSRTQENVLVLLVCSVLCSFVKRFLICSIERIKLRCETKITGLANEYKKKTTTLNTNIGYECCKRCTCRPYKLLRLLCSVEKGTQTFLHLTLWRFTWIILPKIRKTVSVSFDQRPSQG